MEETISTTVEAPQEQTTPEVTETPTIEEIQPEVTEEPVEVEEPTTESVEGEEPPKVEPRSAEAPANAKNWEQIAKDNQASFTRVSQELAELKKQVEANKPQLVQEGKINPQFEQQYKFDVDNREFLAFDNLSRQLEPETRAVVENLLNEAKRLYNPNNNRAYEAKLAQIKDYFRSDIVEQIALEKQNLIGKMKGEFDKALQADKQERANRVAEAIEQVPELRELVVAESENFSPEVLGIIKTMFDYTGGVDIESTQKAISKIKELGVKEYIAKQNAEKAKSQANVPSGETVVQKQSSGLPTADELRNTAGLYEKTVKKLAGSDIAKQRDVMAKLDAVIMKG